MAVTLAEVEQQVVQRTGPFAFLQTSSLTVSTQSRVYADDLQTSLSLGGYVGMWLLRRGKLASGAAVPAFNASDRQRRIVNWEQTLGYLQVDRLWTTAPAATELLEVSYLDPANIIRRACQAGIKRCKYEDRVQVTLTGAANERDLTAALPWLTKRSQVRRTGYKEVSSLYDPVPVRWFDTFESGGHVWLTMSPDPYPQTLYLSVNRPADTLVNGVSSTTGPLLDDDTIPISLEYASAAGHIECWRIAKALLQNAAALGYQISQADAADEFTRQQRRSTTRQPGEWRLSRPLWAVSIGAR